MLSRICPTVAETLETHRLLIDEFGGLHGIRDRGLLESGVLRPRNGYYSSLIEEAAALMESLANNHAFLDGNMRVSFVMIDVMLRANGYFLDAEAIAAHKFITQAMARKRFRFPMICDWICSVVRPLDFEEKRAQRKK